MDLFSVLTLDDLGWQIGSVKNMILDFVLTKTGFVFLEHNSNLIWEINSMVLFIPWVVWNNPHLLHLKRKGESAKKHMRGLNK